MKTQFQIEKMLIFYLAIYTRMFTITPMNDPPVIDPFSVYDVIEGQVSVLHITSYLHDSDTPLEDLVVTGRSDQGGKFFYRETNSGGLDAVGVLIGQCRPVEIGLGHADLFGDRGHRQGRVSVDCVVESFF